MEVICTSKENKFWKSGISCCALFKSFVIETSISRKTRDCYALYNFNSALGVDTGSTTKLVENSYNIGKRGKTSPMEKKKLDLGVLDVLNNFNHFQNIKKDECPTIPFAGYR